MANIQIYQTVHKKSGEAQKSHSWSLIRSVGWSVVCNAGPRPDQTRSDQTRPVGNQKKSTKSEKVQNQKSRKLAKVGNWRT